MTFLESGLPNHVDKPYPMPYPMLMMGFMPNLVAKGVSKTILNLG